MLQIRYVEALLRRCKEDLDLHTAVDTSGFLGDRASDEFLDLVDLFLLDVKSGDAATYHLVTSAEPAPPPPPWERARTPPPACAPPAGSRSGRSGPGSASFSCPASPTRPRTSRP